MNVRFLLLCLMIFLAAATVPYVGTEDAEDWLRWIDNLMQHGLVAGYVLNNHEHPPLLSVLFWMFAQAATFLGLHVYFGLKAGFLLFLIASTIIVYHWSGKNMELTFYSYLFLLISSLCLSYFDILFCPFILLAVYFISKDKISLGVFFFTVAAFIKYPPFIIAPMLAIYLVATKLYGKHDGRAVVKEFLKTMVLPVLFVVIPVFVLFGSEPVHAFKRAFGHGILSAQAFNFNWIVTRIIQIFPDMEFSWQGWTTDDRYIWLKSEWSFMLLRTVVGAFYLSLLVSFISKPKNIETLLLFCIAGHMTYFIFNHGVHENHLFLTCILAIALACIDYRFKALALVLAVISSLNLIAFYGFNGNRIVMWPNWYLDACVFHPASPTNAICGLHNSYIPYFDLKLLLAFFNVFYYFRLWTHLVVKKHNGTYPAGFC